MRKSLVPFVLIALVLAGGVAFAYRGMLRERVADLTRPELPPAQPYQPRPEPVEPEPTVGEPAEPVEAPLPEPEPTPEPKPEPAPTPAPTPSASGANLAVPFTSQAPHANWEMPYQEACEEASLMMVHAYLVGAGAFTPNEADRQILAMVAWEEDHFGYYKDTTAEETAEIARAYYGHAKSRAVAISSMADVKREVDKGNPVILPAAGKMLPNPYFSGDGPLYHMLVVKGYTKDGKIITNDPGTRRGADFLYDPDALWNAVHDWNGGDVANGAKVMVVVEE
jgi:hypothetical protein